MATVSLSPLFNGYQSFLPTGLPNSFGFIKTYAAGSSTPLATYSDSGGTIPNAVSISLNASGYPPGEIWLDATLSYKFVITDTNSNVIGTFDNIVGYQSLNVFSASNGSSLIGFIQSGTGAVATTVQAELRTHHQYPSGFFYAQSGGKVNRLQDRVFIGDACTHDGTGPTPATPDWLTTYQTSVGWQYGSITSAQTAILTSAANASVTNAIGFVVGTQNGNSTSGSYAGALGITAYALNNPGAASPGSQVWAFYGEAHRVNNNGGAAVGIELDVTQKGSALVTINPYTQNGGQTVTFQAASGAEQGAAVTASISGTVLTVTSIGFMQITNGWKVQGVGVTAGTVITSFGTGTGGVGTYNINNSQTVTSRYMSISPMFDNTVAYNVQSNPNTFYVGLNFGATSIYGCDGINGQGLAITMAKGHTISWYESGGNQTSYIWSSATAAAGAGGIQLAQGSVDVYEKSTNTLNWRVTMVANAANYVYTQPGTTGNPATIGALGETNVDLAIFCAGTGLLKFAGGSHVVANGSVATAMSSLGPAGSHTTIQEWLAIKNGSGVVRYIPLF